jgi:predicted thioesterase
MDRIEIGAVREEVVRVGEENAINFLGMPNARVLSTPHMIGYMERTSRNLILTMIDDGDDSVGTVVNVKHLAGAPIGTDVTFRAEVTEVNGRRVTFAVKAYDAQHTVGEGIHERFVVTVSEFADKMKRKLEQQKPV